MSDRPKSGARLSLQPGSLQSMTGFGSGTARDGEIAFEVSLRSVNHRHLDVVYRVPAAARPLTGRMAELLEKRFRRGRIEVAVEQIAGAERLGQLDLEAARWLAGLAERLIEQGVAEGRLQVSDLLAHPAVLRAAGSVPIEVDGPTGRCLFRALEEAADRLLQARQTEGEALLRKVADQVDELAKIASSMRSRVEPAANALMTRYRERLQQLVSHAAEQGTPEVDDARVLQEVAVLAEKADVTEELDRLEIHLEAVREALAGTDAAGRRLDFLAQEILRELNTVGSKSRDGNLSAMVVEGKVFCERLREQAQNVE